MEVKDYKYIVAGAGIFGAIIAERLASRGNHEDRSGKAQRNDRWGVKSCDGDRYTAFADYGQSD